ncbi:PREDICTED: uncharacterized protein LOC106330080 [Brassica oleracea var. oleracea]|uniref:uncharacterized protein LOC106330080 n=1 Tax=Brassica oleracea var. oleracea TaxID=109376 RepID=UPI0006A74D2A|nr:PREDICTED: uncharacterized protein LOC106330080 [Brassica oleracea var. oleracea]
MKVFVGTVFGSTFSFDLDPRNKVFDIKKSIENSQGIPVSMQTLYFNGVKLVVDHYQLRVYRIVNNSRLILLLRDDHVNNQMLHQSPYAIQGFVPSMGRSSYDQVPPSHASASFLNQDPRKMARSNQVLPPSHASEAFFNQDLRMMQRSNQVLHQTQISPVPPSHASASFFNQDPRTMARSNQVPPLSHASEAFYNQDRLVSNDRLFPEMLQDISLKQGFWPGMTTFGDNNKIQESLRRNKMNQDFLQKEPYLPSNTYGAIANENHMFRTDKSSTFGDFSFGDYRHILTDSNWPASTFDEIINKNQVFETEHSSVKSISTEESSSQVFQTKKSPQPPKLTLIMTQYDKPGSKFLVDVNESDNVEELKKELEYLLDLHAEGYFLLHKERVLDDDKSFSMNRVANGDTIEIFPGPVIEDYHT